MISSPGFSSASAMMNIACCPPGVTTMFSGA